MKTNLTILILLISFISLRSQDKNDSYKMPLLGDNAISFVANSTDGKINFPGDYFAKWKVLFFHPAAFTPVCTSELIELAVLDETFKKLKTQIIVISTDGLNSHIEWIKSMESFSYKNFGQVKIPFPYYLLKSISAKRRYDYVSILHFLQKQQIILLLLSGKVFNKLEYLTSPIKKPWNLLQSGSLESNMNGFFPSFLIWIVSVH
jgi:hypothetical protein